MKYYMQQYFKPVTFANKKLQNLSEAVGYSFVEECLKALRIRYTWVVSHLTTKRDIGRYIDNYCQKPYDNFADFSQICIVVVSHPKDLSSTIFLIEADNNQVIAALLRFNKLKAFI
jgi:hypothetical protein